MLQAVPEITIDHCARPGHVAVRRTRLVNGNWRMQTVIFALDKPVREALSALGWAAEND